MTGSFTVASRKGCSQIIGNNSHWSTFKIVYYILAFLYQVFFALRPYGFVVNIMTERKNDNEYFGFLRLACYFINNLKFVAGKINIYLVGSIVLNMTDNLNAESVLADNPFEGR